MISRHSSGLSPGGKCRKGAGCRGVKFSPFQLLLLLLPLLTVWLVGQCQGLVFNIPIFLVINCRVVRFWAIRDSPTLTLPYSHREI